MCIISCSQSYKKLLDHPTMRDRDDRGGSFLSSADMPLKVPAFMSLSFIINIPSGVWALNSVRWPKQLSKSQTRHGQRTPLLQGSLPFPSPPRELACPTQTWEPRHHHAHHVTNRHDKCSDVLAPYDSARARVFSPLHLLIEQARHPLICQGAVAQCFGSFQLSENVSPRTPHPA